MKNACNDYSPDPEAARFPSADVLKKGNKVPALAMSARYADEAELAPKMRRAWGEKIRHLVAFIKHDDLARLTKKDLVGWKDELLKKKPDGSKLSGKTVRNV
jgi:hypothetical protein